MAAKNIGWGLVITGIAGMALSLLIALLLPGRTDIRTLQIFVIEISILVILVGFWLRYRETPDFPPSGSTIRDVATRIVELPVFAWVFAGFLLVYILLFLLPMFLRPGMAMNYFSGYIPNLIPIGSDLTVMVDLIKGWVAGNQSPYTIQFYPPLTYIIFAPLLLIQEPLTLYRFFTLFTFLSYCLLTFLLPLKIIDRKHITLALLIFITGLFSYGFQFELERGQYNVFTFLLCLTSIYIFHYHPRYRLLAYFLFSLSVQLKLYPAIFVVMFVDDWRDWKTVVRRFAGIGLLNLLLFFVMGFQTFWDFIRSVTAQMVNPSWIGVWNHSISSFISMVKQDGLGLISFETLRVFRHNAGWFETSMLLVFIVLFVAALLISHLGKRVGLDPYLLLACTIGALILPISYDYTLSILAAPMLLFLAGIAEQNDSRYRPITIMLILGIAVAYFSILIPYNFRPYILNNSFPLLFLILILATLLNFVRYQHDKVQNTRADPAV